MQGQVYSIEVSVQKESLVCVEGESFDQEAEFG